MRHVTRMNEACHTYEWGTSHVWMRHVTHMNEARHTYKGGMSHVWMRHLTRMDELQMQIRERRGVPLHAWMSHVQCFMSHATVQTQGQTHGRYCVTWPNRVYMHTCIYIYVYVNVCVYVYVSAYVYVYACVYMCICTCNVYLHIQMYMYMYIYMHIYAYGYIGGAVDVWSRLQDTIHTNTQHVIYACTCMCTYRWGGHCLCSTLQHITHRYMQHIIPTNTYVNIYSWGLSLSKMGKLKVVMS